MLVLSCSQAPHISDCLSPQDINWISWPNLTYHNKSIAINHLFLWYFCTRLVRPPVASLVLNDYSNRRPFWLQLCKSTLERYYCFVVRIILENINIPIKPQVFVIFFAIFSTSSQTWFQTSRKKATKWCFSSTQCEERSRKHSFSCQESEGAESGRHPLQVLLLITFPCKWASDRLECVLRPLHGYCRKGGFIGRSWLLKHI